MRHRHTAHARGFGGSHTIHRVFDNDTLDRLQPQFLRRRKENVRRRFLARYVFRTHRDVPDLGLEPDFAQIGVELDAVGARSDGDFQSGILAGADQFYGPGKGIELRRHPFQIDFVSPFFRGGEIDRKVVFLRHAADVSVLARTDERPKILRPHRQSFLPEHRHRGRVDERFGIGQHAVHVENHRPDVSLAGHAPKTGEKKSLPQLLSRGELSGKDRTGRWSGGLVCND